MHVMVLWKTVPEDILFQELEQVLETKKLEEI